MMQNYNKMILNKVITTKQLLIALLCKWTERRRDIHTIVSIELKSAIC